MDCICGFMYVETIPSSLEGNQLDRVDHCECVFYLGLQVFC